MRNIIGEFMRMFVALIASLTGIMMYTNYVFSPDTEKLVFPASFYENGVEKLAVPSEYSLWISDNELTIKKGDDFYPLDEEIAQAQLTDGTDISSFIVVSGAPEDTSEPGDYELTYYLKFEGSTINKKMTLHIEE